MLYNVCCGILTQCLLFLSTTFFFQTACSADQKTADKSSYFSFNLAAPHGQSPYEGDITISYRFSDHLHPSSKSTLTTIAETYLHFLRQNKTPLLLEQHITITFDHDSQSNLDSLLGLNEEQKKHFFDNLYALASYHGQISLSATGRYKTNTLEFSFGNRVESHAFMDSDVGIFHVVPLFPLARFHAIATAKEPKFRTVVKNRGTSAFYEHQEQLSVSDAAGRDIRSLLLAMARINPAASDQFNRQAFNRFDAKLKTFVEFLWSNAPKKRLAKEKLLEGILSYLNEFGLDPAQAVNQRLCHLLLVRLAPVISPNDIDFLSHMLKIRHVLTFLDPRYDWHFEVKKLLEHLDTKAIWNAQQAKPENKPLALIRHEINLAAKRANTFADRLEYLDTLPMKGEINTLGTCDGLFH